MILNKIKQNLAGFAVVALAFAGFSAMAPASATAYASNAGSIGDPSRNYVEQRTVTLDSNGQATLVVPTSNTRVAYNFQTSLSTVQSTALRGQTISFEYSMMNGATAVTTPGINVNAYANNQYLTPTGTGASATFTWPTTTGANDNIGFYPYWNGSPALAAGTYTVTFKIKANGTVLTSSNATFYQSVQVGFGGANSATLTAGSNLNSVGFGNVCVDPALVTNGDVLTARVLVNGVEQNAANWTPNAYWKAAGTYVGNMVATHTVLTAEIPSLAISVGSVSPSGVAAGSAFTTDLSITKANGTEVTYPCPTPSPGSVVVASSSNTSITGTITGNAEACLLRRVMGQMLIPAGYAAPSNGSCTLTPFGPPGSTFIDGTYVLLVTTSGYWSSMPNESTNNPQFTIAAAQAQNNNVQQQQQVTPTLPTNVPLVAPISVPQAGFKPGGALVLDGRNMAAVTSIKIGSTATTTVKTASGIEVKVPTDLAPGAHDLLVTTATGSTLFVGAVKVADPAVVAAKEAVAKAAASILYRAPIDLTVGKTVSSAQAAAAKNFASQYRNAKSAVCIAIPATKATASAALAAANKVCGTFKAQIPGIKTTVVLGAPSGDKVNRVSAEVQG